jgi:phosphatidate cytidylyltransferase
MAQADSGPGAGSGVLIRLASAVVLAPPVLLAVWYGDPWFKVACALMVGIVLWEWRRLCGNAKWDGLTRHPRMWFAAGAAYVAAACFMLILLRAADTGRETVIWLLLAVWAADTGAYASGRLIGGPKLAPRISPKKTWAGLIGAVVVSAAAGGLLADAFTASSVLDISADPLYAAVIGAVVGVVSQVGDLLESGAKRKFQVKDASGLIPGHGGLMDRVDGLIAATVAVFAVTLAYKGPLHP